MEPKKSQYYFVIALLTLALVLSFFIIKPFIYSLILAVIFAVVFQPIQRKMLSLKGIGPGWASFFTILILVVFILVPLSFVGIQIFKEAQILYTYLSNEGAGKVLGMFNSLSIPGFESVTIDAETYLKRGLEIVLNNVGGFFSSAIKLLGNVFVFLLVLYYVLRDGKTLRKNIISMSPLSDEDDEAISGKLSLAINSVIKGNLTIAVIQGVLVAIGFSIFGVPQSVLWGTIAAVTALIPSVGTAVVLVPGIIYLFLSGHTLAAVGLLVWGLLAVGLVDNLLGPKLVSRGMHLHPMLILLSVLGGLSFFGPAGFLLGPLTLSLVFALLDIYTAFSKKRINSV